MAMRSTFAARVGAKPAVRGARPASRMSCMAYKVTLKTPSGDKTIECPADTYILDAAEVRRSESAAGVRDPPARARLAFLLAQLRLHVL